jgi:DNA-directed RNA polymerase subunit E'/Rpb7
MSKNIKKKTNSKNTETNQILDNEKNDILNDELENKNTKTNRDDLKQIQTKEIISSNIHNPSTITTLVSPVMLLPNQMDNKMYIHLKSNLKNKLEGKCYKNYGFINKIFTIDETSDGIIEAEDPTCSAKIIVKFTCSLCLPIVNKEIICKIDRINKALIMAINGPIKTIITVDKINKEHFFPDPNRNIRIKGNSDVLVPNMYIRIIVLSKSFSDHDRNIIVIGYLQDMASKNEIEQYLEQNTENNLEQNNFMDEED